MMTTACAKMKCQNCNFLRCLSYRLHHASRPAVAGHAGCDAGRVRKHSTCTMDLVPNESFQGGRSDNALVVNSTLQHVVGNDIESVRRRTAPGGIDPLMNRQRGYLPQSVVQPHWRDNRHVDASRSGVSSSPFSSAVRMEDPWEMAHPYEAIVVEDDEDNDVAAAREMDLIEAAELRHLYDKVLLLVHHGEDESQLPPSSNRTGLKRTRHGSDTSRRGVEEKRRMVRNRQDPALSGRGVGQSLSIGRRTAAFCNDETGLVPELVVSAPSRRSLQTAQYAFPYYAPSSVTGVTWICHPLVASGSDANANQGDVSASASTRGENGRHHFFGDLMREYRGVDFSLCGMDAENGRERLNRHDPDNSDDTVSLMKALDFLDWLQTRSESIIVVSGHSRWLDSFGECLRYSGCTIRFQNGELRAIGVNFRS